MLGRLVQPELHSLIEQRNWRELREVLVDLSVHDVAEVLSEVNGQDRAVVFRLLPRAMAGEVFEYLPPEDQQALLESLGDVEAARVLNAMSPDDRTDLLEEMPDRVARRALRLLSAEQLRIARELLAYPEGSVGRKMTPEYVKVKSHLTCAQCVDFLRHVGPEKETVYYVYVVDERNVPLGVVSLRQLVTRPASRTVRELLEEEDEEVVRIRADAPQEEAVNLLAHYDLVALPVVDSHDRLVGIVTVDDVMDIQEEEATEDMQLMSGVVPTETDYLQARFLDLFPKRLLALVLLAITATFAGKVMERYEITFREDIGEAVFNSLALFIIVLMAASGNTGSQAGTLVIRALALDELRGRDVPRMIAKESLVGTALGLSLGVVVAMMGWMLFESVQLETALIVGGAVAVSVTCCNMVGALLPVALRSLGLDPAFFANPVITTISDFAALFIFFESSRALLGGR